MFPGLRIYMCILSYLSADVLLLSARTALWVSLFSPPSPVTTCHPFNPRDCHTSYLLLRVLSKQCAFQLITTLPFCRAVKRKHFVLVFSPWCLAPRNWNLQVFCSVHQSYYYNNPYKIGLTITEQNAAASWPGIPVPVKLKNTSLGSSSGKMPWIHVRKSWLRRPSPRSSAALFSHSPHNCVS